jgi:hypothetical protein
MATDLLAMIKEQGPRFLEQGESVVAAFQAKPRGSGNANAPGGAPRAIGRAWAKGSREKAESAGLQLASPMALALTQHRIVVFTGKAGGASGKLNELTDLVSSAPLSEVESIRVKRLLVGKTVSIAMAGGEVKLEVPAGQDPNEFAEHFERIKSSAGS